MATLALKPAFPIRTRSSPPRRDHHHKQRGRALQSRSSHTATIATGAIALTFFCVLAPMIYDPAERLLALDSTSTMPAEEFSLRDAWAAQSFELTPTMLGPAITAEALVLAEADGSMDEDESVLTMPELEVRAAAPLGAEATPPG